MLPELQALARRHAAFCLKYAVPWRECRAALGEALAQAAELAGGRAEDEPAALFFALNARIRALGAAWELFPIAEARRLARHQGLDLALAAGDADLENLRLSLLDRDDARRSTFDDLRTFFAARTTPSHLRIVR